VIPRVTLVTGTLLVRKLLLLFLVLFLVLAVVKTTLGQLNTTNWAGYAINSSGITEINGSWTVPEIQCSVSNTNVVSQGVSVWIGLDGLSGAAAIPEQVGTNSFCRNGTPVYYAWEEDPTLGPSNTNSAAQAFPGTSYGDHMTGSITYLGNSYFRLSIADAQTDLGRTYVVSIPNAPRASAEWIVETFHNINTGNQVTLPKFQPITFTDCSAAVNNVAGSILQNNAEPISITDSNGNTIAAPQGLNQAGTSFEVAELTSSTTSEASSTFENTTPTYAAYTTPTSVTPLYTTSSETLSMQTVSMGLSVEIVLAIVVGLIMGSWIYYRPRLRIETNAPTAQTKPSEPRSTEKSPMVTAQFCIQCGTELSVGSRFCHRCGTGQDL